MNFHSSDETSLAEERRRNPGDIIAPSVEALRTGELHDRGQKTA